ncbi:MAG TPA: response regulator [Kiloniellaceae bacterium]|nr:response regulator [Kiloniellaceae bacterium]
MGSITIGKSLAGAMFRTFSKPLALGLVFAAQLGIFGLLAVMSYERTVEQERLRLTVDVRATAEQIAYAMRLVDTQLDHLEELAGSNPDWTEELHAETLAALGRAADSGEHVLGAALADSSGIVRGLVTAGGGTKVSGLDVSDRSYFTAQRDGLVQGSFLSEPILSRVRGEMILVVSRRLSAADGGFRGIVMMSVKPSYFAQKFALLGDFPISRRVLTNDGELVAIKRPDVDGEAAAEGETPTFLEQAYLSRAGIFWERGTRGRDVLTATAPVAGWSLTAAATMNMGAILNDWKANLMGKGLALLLSLLAMLALILLVYRHQDRGIRLERRFRSLIEEAIDGVIIHDRGQVLFANDAGGQILGLEHGTELRGRFLPAFAPEEGRAEMQRRWRAVQESGGAETMRRVPMQRVDGTPISLDISSQAIDWGGKGAVRSSLSDVTEQVLLAERDKRRAAVLAAVNDAHSIYLNQTRNRAAFEELLEKILHLSGAGYGMIAEKLEDDAGKPYLKTLAISNIAWDEETRLWYESSTRGGMEFRNLDNLRGEPLRTGEVLIANNPRSHPVSSGVPCGHLAMDNLLILPLVLEDGILGEVALANRPGGFDGEIAEELGLIVQAITRIVADYRSVRLREAAERASRSKSKFLAHMSHELRTPLSGVIANLELLCGTRLQREQVDLVEASMSAGEALLGIIGNTLDFSKIEADELVLDMSEFDPAALVREVRSIFAAAALEKGLHISVTVDPQAPRRVMADERRLHQILANLVGNSLKFTDRGRVEISLSARRIGDDQAQLRLSVDDTGIGFDPDKIDTLFKPYGQETQSTARVFGGTGLGLTIAQRLVDLHGGEITCASRPGWGSSFIATFPARVTDWGCPKVLPLQGQTLVFLFSGEPPSDALIGELTEAGADVRILSTPAALGDATSVADAGKQTLIIDWDSTEGFDVGAVLSRYGDDFKRINAAVSSEDPNHRRQVLYHPVLRLHDKPLTAVNLSNAASDDRGEVDDAAEEGQASRGNRYQVFAPGKAPRILVVEDQPMNQLVLRRQLRRLGADCDLAEHGAEALELLDRSPYDLIIADCSMPVMDGFQLSRAVRALEAQGRPRSAIIALTANAVTGDAQRCYDAGMDAYLSKPVGLSELSRALEQWWHPSLNEGAAEAVAAESPADLPRDRAEPKEATETSQPPIDRQGLAELIGEDDEGTINALIADFFDNWQTALFALYDPWSSRDAVRLRAAAHAAKGTARYGMAPLLATTCEALEKQAEGEDWENLRNLIETLETETDRLQSYLRSQGLVNDVERQSA